MVVLMFISKVMASHYSSEALNWCHLNIKAYSLKETPGRWRYFDWTDVLCVCVLPSSSCNSSGVREIENEVKQHLYIL